MTDTNHILVNYDFHGNQLIRTAVQNVTIVTDIPASPTRGQLLYAVQAIAVPALEANTLYYWTGTAWQGAGGDFKSLTSLTQALVVTPNNGAYTINLVPGNIAHSTLGALTAVANPHAVTLANLAAHDAGNKKLTGGAAGTSENDFVIKKQLDDATVGLHWTDSVKAASIGPVILTGPQTVDGVAVIAGDRVLVKDQANAVANGIYLVNAGAWSRSIDANENAELVGLTCGVDIGGTINAGSAWTQTASPVIIGTTDITFSKISESLTYSPGLGIDITGTVISAKLETGKGLDVSGAGIKTVGADIAGKGLEGDATDTHKVNINVDDSTVEINSSSEVQVKDAGVTLIKLNADVIGRGLKKGDTGIEVEPYVDVSRGNYVPVYVGTPPLPLGSNDKGVAVLIDNDRIKVNTSKQLTVNLQGTGMIGKFTESILGITSNIPHPIFHSLGTEDIVVTAWMSRQKVDMNFTIVDSNNITVQSNIDITGTITIVIIG